MTIAFLIDGFSIGGTELNSTRTLEAFARRGVRVSVLHFHRDGELRERIAAAGHDMVHVPIAPLWSPRIAIRVGALANTLRRLRATVVHSQDVYSNILGVAAGRMLRRMPVLTSRRWKDQVPRPGFTPMNAWAHRRSTLVLPNSPALIETLQSEGVRTDRIAVHENFIDDAALTLMPAEARARWRQSLGIPGAAVVVGCVARLTPVKRHDVLIDAFAIVARAMPDAMLVLVGDGEIRHQLEGQVDAAGLRGRVVFTGTLPNFPLSQQLFDIAVLTSQNEGFPNSLVEASACAVPLVSTRVGGVPDVLIEGETGLSVPIADVAQTAAAILALATDPAQRRRMGDAARTLVRSRFSETAAVDRLLALYARVSR
ncbi:MAG TPA: glycosyltransferase [Gemmatimonadaceae bacterium]|nr:glycosyltransferase [Gemmatimonadaceae bacterium]